MIVDLNVCRLSHCNSFKTTSSSTVNSLKSHFRSSIEKLKKIFKIGGGGWKRVPTKASASTSSSIDYLDLKHFGYSDESESLINSKSQSRLQLKSSSLEQENCGDFQNIFAPLNTAKTYRKSDSSSYKTPPVMKRITHQLIDDEVPLIKF